jgi:predicted NBD/HSP70 family sugar kinase
MAATKGGNPGRVLSFLFANGPTTRATLARGLGLTRTAITDLAGSLVAAGLLEEDSGKAPAGLGRPGQLIRLRPDAAHFVGAEIGVERLLVTILDLAGTVRGRVEQRGSLVGQEVDTVLGRLVSLVETARRRHGALGLAGGLGVSVPGFMTRDGVVLSAPLLGWRNVDVAGALRRHFDGPIVAENDANATAHGEWHFVPQHRGGDLLAVVLANGIGCGLVADGRILRGTHGLAGELGHMPMAVTPDRENDWGETDWGETDWGETDWGETNWEARAGLLAAQPGSSRVMPDDWPLWLARGLATAAYAYDPETIVIAGELTDLFLAHRQDVEAHLRRLLVPGFPLPTLIAARFGADGCAIGAASLLHARFLDQTTT